jgi:phage N-6-adenine-methyltransferase
MTKGAKTTGAAGRQNWRTPPELFEFLDLMFGPFALDVAADEHNHLVDLWLNDGLQANWTQGGGRTVFCNPPWSEPAKWVDKAVQEAMDHGIRTVMVLPASTDTAWFAKAWQHGHILLLHKRVAYLNPDGSPSSPDRGTLIAYITGEPDGTCSLVDWQAVLPRLRDEQEFLAVLRAAIIDAVENAFEA